MCEIQITGPRRAQIKINNVCTDLSFVVHSVSNKFEVVKTVFDGMCGIPNFNDWAKETFGHYIKTQDGQFLVNQYIKLRPFVVLYVESLGIAFEDFVDYKKRSKTSIIFTEDELKEIAITSTSLKIYYIIGLDKKLQPSEAISARIQQDISKNLLEMCVDEKIFRLIRSKINLTSFSNKFMWDFLAVAISETPDAYSFKIFNWIMQKIIALINIKQNPIPFLISTIRDSISYLFQDAHKDTIVYGDIFEDSVHNMVSQDIDEYACNDLIYKLAHICSNQIVVKHEKTQSIIFDRIEALKANTKSTHVFNLPLVAKILEVPYDKLRMISPQHGAFLSLFIFNNAIELRKKYPALCNLLTHFAANDENKDLRSSYKIKNVDLVINDRHLMFGLSSVVLKYEVLSLIVGTIISHKKNLLSLYDNHQFPKTYNSNQIEREAIDFYSKFYADDLGDLIDPIRERIEKLL